jgi:alkylation response protein AidB-like acyl-CoA dehydrogenase
MDLEISAEQQQLVEALRSLFADRCSPDVVRASEPGGFDGDLWEALVQLTGPAIGVPEDQGGGGASLLDLELIGEQVGSCLAPVPFIDGAVSARVLASVGDPGREALEALIAEPVTVSTVALRPAVGGVAELVPSGSIASMVIALEGDELVVHGGGPASDAPRNLGSAPLADRRIGDPGRSVLTEGVVARRSYEQARDEWRVLTSGALVGLGAAALGLGVEYAKERHQFGVPIGSFQSIARDLADVATLVEGARLLARQAAWARAEDDQDFHSLAGMAFLFATRAARRASNVALHVHGGYGFTLEYDIQLYYRRAQAWPLALGDPKLGVAQLADALFGPIEVA